MTEVCPRCKRPRPVGGQDYSVTTWHERCQQEDSVECRAVAAAFRCGVDYGVTLSKRYAYQSRDEGIWFGEVYKQVRKELGDG